MSNKQIAVCTGAGFVAYLCTRAVMRSFKRSANNVIMIENYLNLDILKSFKNQLKSYTKDLTNFRDINIVLKTLGGSGSIADAICKIIMKFKETTNYSRKVNCYIPEYAFSGGTLIALTCDKIIVTNTSLLSPCDGQYKNMPVSAIIEAVAEKKEKKQKLDEKWLVDNKISLNYIKEQKELFDKIAVSCKYSEDQKNLIYKTFFDGTNNHCRVFLPEDLQDLKLNIKIIEKMPDFIC